MRRIAVVGAIVALAGLGTAWPIHQQNEATLTQNPPQLSWTRVAPHDPAFAASSARFGRALMHAVIPWRGGYLAVGNSTVTTRVAGQQWTHESGAVWTSLDGTNWSRTSDGLGSNIASLFDATSFGSKLVAVGLDGGKAAAWVSSDGIDWREAYTDPDIGGNSPGTGMSSVTVGGAGLVAVGWQGSEQNSEGDFVQTVGMVWTSPDGEHWTKQPNVRAFATASGWIHDVTAGGPGLVAVGESGSRAAIWTSTDGVTWETVPMNRRTFPAGSVVNSLTPGGPGFVAVGSLGSFGQSAAVWTSADANSWRLVSAHPRVFAGPGFHQMVAVVATPDGIVAVGGSATTGLDLPDYHTLGFEQGETWSSVDGLTWERQPSEGLGSTFGTPPRARLTMNAVVSTATGVLAVGSNGTKWNTRAAVWISGARPSHTPTPTPTPSAHHSQSQEPAPGIDGPSIIGLNGEHLRRLDKLPSDAHELALSPDGQTLAFVSGPGRPPGYKTKIAIAKLDGTDVRFLTDPSMRADAPAWSPDGTQLAFVAHHLDTNGVLLSSGIFVMSADGSNIRQLTTGPVDSDPRWSPDGTQLVYWGIVGWTGPGSGSREVFEVPALGGSRRSISPGSSPDWSPDGTRIAFIRNGNWKNHVGLVDADGGTAPVGIPSGLGGSLPYPWYPTWSPDGRTIAITVLCRGAAPYGPGDGFGIGLVDVTSGTERIILSCSKRSYGDRPSWLPDGSGLLVG